MNTTTVKAKPLKYSKPKLDYAIGYVAGQNAVRNRPPFAPRNPYSDDTEPEKFRGWDDGADASGLSGHHAIYRNGILIQD